MTDPIDLCPAPFIKWQIIDEEDGTVRIAAINRSGWAEQELWCSIASARELAILLLEQLPLGDTDLDADAQL